LWTYHDAEGEPVGHVLRWDWPGGKKDIRPIALHADGWRISAMPPLRPLFGLPELAAATRVVVCEGEKAMDAARGLGLMATTSAGGAAAVEKTDWRRLAGKEVWILPDNDSAGRKCAEIVAGILATLNPPATALIVELPGLPEGGDIVEWIEAHGDAAEPESMRTELEAIAQAAPSGVPATENVWPEIESFDQRRLPAFPTSALPDELRAWVEATSHATQTPADLAGLLSMAVLSACIARRVTVEPRPGWIEPTNLYVAVLLEPGNRKSAVFSEATRPLRELEAQMIDAARPAVARQQSDRRQQELRLKKLEKEAADDNNSDAAEEARRLSEKLAELPEPVLPRLLVDDATSEKLGMMLAEQGGRIASMSAEGGVFDLMAGQYSKTGMPLADKPAFRGRGLLARFSYASPESWIGHRQIATSPVSEIVKEAYRQLVRKLASLEGEDVLGLVPDASRLFREWEAEIETMLADGGSMENMRDWGGKLAGATLRLAAVLHCVKHGPHGQIDRGTLVSAIELSRYLVPHAEAALALMQATDEAVTDEAKYVWKWIERHDLREFTKRDVHQHGKRRFPRADDIDPALAELTRRGYIRFRRTDSAGPGRKPSPTYDVNPDAFPDGQAGERSHNSQNAADGSASPDGPVSPPSDSGNNGNGSDLSGDEGPYRDGF
jgi:Protein of unknown function (DUF3987)